MKKQSTLTHRRPNWGSRISWLLVAVMFLGGSMVAQSGDGDDQGKVVGGYQMNQSVEIGGRIVDAEGSQAVYNTFVDLHSGPRLLDYSAQFHSIDHNGAFFDDLTFSNSGYGGDPETLTRLRASKNRWYDFSMQLRRNVNFYDYNAFANPYNYGPTVASPTKPTAVNFNDSLHLFNTRRKMGDFNLTVLPQSKVRFRFGYTRVLNDGPSFSSFHEGTDVQLLQDYAVQQDTWQFGADWKLAPRTQLTYDHILVSGDVRTSYRDANVGNAFITLGGANFMVDPGAIWNTYYGQPCTNPSIVGGSLTPTTCGVYASYQRTQPVHTNLQTDKLSLNSNYFKKLDVTGSFSYTYGGAYIRNYLETAQAYVTRTNEVGFQFTGPTNANRNASAADFGLTYHISDAWSISNQLRWVNYRQPGVWNSVEYACFPNVTTGVTVFTTPGVPVGGGTSCAGIPASGTPQHTSSSGADYDAVFYNRSFNMATVYNTTSLAWDPNRHFAAHLGYRIGDVQVRADDFDSETAIYLATNFGVGNTRRAPGTYVTAVPDADDALVTNDHQTEHAFLVGLQVRPFDAWRINADYEYVYDDIPLTPIAPQHASRLKVRSNLRLNRWLTVAGTANLVDNRNSVVAATPDDSNAFPVGYNNPRHTDSSNVYALTASFDPVKYFGLDLGYTFNNFESQTGSCIMVSSGGGNVQSLTPEGGAIQRCPNVGDPFVPGIAGAAIPSVLNYKQDVNTAYAALRIHPVNRITVTFGLDASTDSGRNDWLRADTLAKLRFPVDAVGNVVYGGNALAGPIVGYANAPNPWQPLGTLYMKWLKPNAEVQYEIRKNLTFKGGFNYWDYREKGPNGPLPGLLYSIAPRNFTAKAGTLALRYTF